MLRSQSMMFHRSTRMRLVLVAGLAALLAHTWAADALAAPERDGGARGIERRLDARLQQHPAADRRSASEEPSSEPSPPEVAEPVVAPAPLDVQVPVATDRRPAVVVVWLADKDVPPAEALTPSPPMTLYADDIGALYRRLRDRLLD